MRLGPTRRLLLAGLCAALAVPCAAAQAGGATDLKRLSLEELLGLEVRSVSKRDEPLSRAPAAVTVITAEEIRRFGVQSLPEALRLATGVAVAQQTQTTWAISARGFNSGTANKLLVLIDGRTVYSPLFAGVFWDVQDTEIDEIERIEVIRGPGATLWGANAVNGVINVVTRSAPARHGARVKVAAGNEEKAVASLGYGGALGRGAEYRVYARYRELDDLRLADGGDAGDELDQLQAGFRLQWRRSTTQRLALQGDLYTGSVGRWQRPEQEVRGGNLLARLTHATRTGGEVRVQAYVDRSFRDQPGDFREQRTTYDLEVQHEFRWHDRHVVVWGAGYRVTADDVTNSPTVAWVPEDRTLHLGNLFVQDEITLSRHTRLTLGSKFEYNDFTGLEAQPSVRVSYAPRDRYTLWAAASRAMRTPSRLDTDVRFLRDGVAFLAGSPDFQSEELLALEAGLRFRPAGAASVDVATFVNRYDHLRSVAPDAGTGTLVIRNDLNARAYGLEVEARWQPAPWCLLAGDVTLLRQRRTLDPGGVDVNDGAGEGNDPEVHGSLRASFDLGPRLEFDASLRYVGELPRPEVRAYTELDLRLGWQPRPGFALSLVGRNLLHASHPEFGPATAAREEVERRALLEVRWAF